MEPKVDRELMNVFEKCIDDLGNAMVAFPWENKEAYKLWLAQTYFLVRHTTAFLALASAKYGPNRRDDHYKMVHHLNEELNHDKLALNDLKAMGGEMKQMPELPQTAALYQSQYYFIEHLGPSSLYGYALVLEGLAANKASHGYKATNQAFGAKCTTFFKVHTIVDQDHFREGQENLSQIPKHEIPMIIQNLKQSTYFYLQMLDEIKNAVAGKGKKKLVA